MRRGKAGRNISAPIGRRRGDWAGGGNDKRDGVKGGGGGQQLRSDKGSG